MDASMTPGPKGLKVAVLSCGALGVEVSNRLVELTEVESVTLVLSPYRRGPARGFWGMTRHTLKMEGIPGVLRGLRRRLSRVLAAGSADPVAAPPEAGADPRVSIIHVDDFHSSRGLEALREHAPDLGVLAGTYILKEEVFSLPPLGSVNLHSGKVPEYRGAAPAFWELYNGEVEVGITIHEVTARLDAGQVHRLEVFPLDPAPPGDPIEYVERFRREVLRPNGIRMIAEVVRDIALGQAHPVPQDPSRARTYRTPDYRARQELRRRVASRRRELKDEIHA